MDQPVDCRLPRHDLATSNGDIITQSYHTAQPAVGQVADSYMENMFDFDGYHDDQQPYTRSSEQETAELYQHHDDLHSKQPMRTGQLGEINDCYSDDIDDDGWQSLFDSAFANYYSDNPLKCDLVLQTSTTFAADLADPPGSVDVNEINPLSKSEKWNVDRASMEYLASVQAVSAPVDSFHTRCGLRPALRDIKLEEPVLQSDPATDMLRLHERNAVRLDSKGMMPFPLDKLYDQDSRWSSKTLKLPEDIDNQLAIEKLVVDSETGHFLRQVVEDMKDDLKTSLAEERKLKALVRPITPPLLSVTPPYSPGKMLSIGALLPYTSTPEDPLVREGEDLEAQIMIGEDIMITDSSDPQPTEVHSPLKNSVNGASSSPLRRKSSMISDVKVSSPLLALEQDGPPTKKSRTVAFAEEVEAFVPRRDSNDVSTDPCVAAHEALAVISAMIEPLAQSAIDQASSEQLVEIDTTVRREVPHIEDVDPTTPWALYSGRHPALLREAVREISKTEKKWSGASSLDCLLPWSPFPACLGKPKAEGDFDDGSYTRYLVELDIEDKVDLHAMIWKPEGLRLLKLNDEDELNLCEHSPPDEHQHHGYLSQGTRVADDGLHDPTHSLHFPPAQQTRGTGRTLPAAAIVTVPSGLPKPQAKNSRDARSHDLEPKVSSMQALLEKRKQQLQRENAKMDAKLRLNIDPTKKDNETSSSTKEMVASASHGTLSGFLATQGVGVIPREEIHVLTTRKAEASVESTGTIPTPAPAQIMLDVPTPQFTITKSSLPVVVSSAIMANRQLVRKLRRQLPAIRMIERESTLVYGKRKETFSSPREADLTLSPSTGLICTTLQKLKQRPLPGQGASFIGVREHIAGTAPRYERLIVLLSEGTNSTNGAQDTIRTLDERDSIAIVDLVGFVSQLDTEVQVLYVPGGDDELVKWIAAAATRYASCIDGITLLDEETVWERFLRRAGMNVFAAQVVLDQLKPPASQSGSRGFTKSLQSPSSPGRHSYGLAAFVSMHVEERIKRFGPSIGGERMLMRVSMAIDGSWKIDHGR